MNKPSIFSLTALSLAMGLALTGCGGGGGGTTTGSTKVQFDASTSITKLGNSIILAGYQALDVQAVLMKAAIDALADGTATDNELEAAQAQWKAARVAWESGEAHIFGPIDALGVDPTLDSWPLSTADLEAILAGAAVDAATVRDSLGTDVQGFHTMEFLLFGDGISNNDKVASELTAAEISYLSALAEVMVERTHQLLSAWTTQWDPAVGSTGPYIDELITPASDKLYVNQAAVVEELINGIIGIVDEVGNGKIADPFGGSAAAADTSLVESQYSWNSLTDFHNNIQGVRNLYVGQIGADGNATSQDGLYDFVLAHNSTLAARILDEINAAMDAIALIDGDGDATTTDIVGDGQIGSAQVAFRNAISDEASGGRARIQTAIDALGTLQTTLENDVLGLIAETEFSDS